MENFDALSLVIISLGAFLLPLIAQRISIPSIVLEIAYGILVGPVLGIVKISEFISGLAIFGFMLLMFLSGFEIELDTFREKGLKTLSIPLAIYVATVATSFYLIITLDYPIFLALVLCTTSVDIVITVLRSDDTIKTNYGQSLFMSALIADIFTLIGVTVFASLQHSEGFSISNLNVILYFLIVILILRIIRRVAWWNPQIFSRMFDGNDPEEMGIRSSIALMLTLVGVAVLFDIEYILGAFLAGGTRGPNHYKDIYINKLHANVDNPGTYTPEQIADAKEDWGLAVQVDAILTDIGYDDTLFNVTWKAYRPNRLFEDLSAFPSYNHPTKGLIYLVPFSMLGTKNRYTVQEPRRETTTNPQRRGLEDEPIYPGPIPPGLWPPLSPGAFNWLKKKGELSASTDPNIAFFGKKDKDKGIDPKFFKGTTKNI